MDKAESCFVCNQDVDGMGVLLSTETTFYTKTAFPTKLMQLLGDAFMVVILEDDKLCFRCTNLINRTDKLEQDLRQIKTMIMGFLNEKYDLNKEEEFSSSVEGLQDLIESYPNEEISLVNLPNINIKHTGVEKHQLINHLNDTEELLTFEGIDKDYCDDVTLTSETMISSDHFSNNNSSHEIVDIGDPAQSLESQDVVVLKRIEKEYVVSDYSVNLPSTVNNHISTASESSEKVVTVLNYEHSHFENKAKTKTLNDDSGSSKTLTNILSSNVIPDVELPKETSGTVCETKLLNTDSSNKPSKGRRRQTFITKQMNHKYTKKERPVQKLQSIIPQFSNTEEMLSCPNIIQNSNCSTDSLIGNNHSKLHSCSRSVCSDVENTTKVKPLNNKTETNLNQQLKAVKEGGNNKKEHIQGQKNFKCSFCVKSFKRKRGLQYHEASHKGEFAHCCEFCGKGFNKMDKLEDHRGKHTKEERYICDVCGKTFFFQSTYWIHRKWHDNPFPYKCDECNKPFKHSSQLAVHRRRHHTKERPYKCSYCPLTFNVSTTLKQHLMLHTKQYRYKCTTCDKGFTTRCKYTNHLARKHDIFFEKLCIDPKDYKMVVCDNVVEETETESLSSPKTVNESVSNIQIIENPKFIFHNNQINCQVEIIVPSVT